MGVIMNALNRSLSLQQLYYIINHSKIKILFVDQQLIPIVETFDFKKVPSIKHIIFCGPNQQVKYQIVSIKMGYFSL